MKKNLVLPILFSLLFSLSGCDILFELLGSVESVKISGTVSVPSTVAAGHKVWVGLLSSAPLAAPSPVSAWVESVQITVVPGGTSAYSFSEVEPGSYIVGAFYDLNDNSTYDQDEPAGGYPAPMGGTLYSFNGDFTQAAVTISTDSLLPATPTGLAVGGATATSLTVTWTAVSGAAGYQLYRDTNATTGSFATRVYNDADTTYTDNDVTSNKTYYYKVKAVNDYGSSALSAAVSGKTLSAAAPAVPADLAAGGATDTSLTLSWTATAGATGYQVYRATKAGGTFTNEVYAGSETSFVDGGLVSGTPYYYKVKAANTYGSSALSAAVSGTTTGTAVPPETPTGLTVDEPGSAGLTVSWTGVSGATSYQVYRSTAAAGPFTVIVYDDETAVFVDSGLSSGTTYHYVVRATNSGGSSSQSSAVSGTTAPGAPTGLTVLDTTAGGLSVSWTAVSGAESYRLYRDESADGTFTTLAYEGTDTSFMDSGLERGTTYYYVVRAVAGGLSSDGSAQASGITIPAAPQDLAVGGATSTSLAVSWTAVTGASSYVVNRDESATGTFTTTAYTGTGTDFTDTGLSSGTTFHYVVFAVNAEGGTSEASASVSATTLPQTPGGLGTGATTASSITLVWYPVAVAESYSLYRSSSITGPFTNLVYSGQDPTYVDTGLLPGTTYYYVVKSYSAGLYSDASYQTSKITVPATPTGLTVSGATVSSLNVSWTAVTGAAYYYVYRETYGSVYTGSSLSFTDSGLESCTTYNYLIVAGNESGTSDPSSTVSGATSPSAPTGLAVGVGTSSSLAVSWTAVTGASLYNLYRSTSASGPYTQVWNTTSASYTNNSLTAATRYYYKVTALNSANVESAQSGTVSGWTLATNGMPLVKWVPYTGTTSEVPSWMTYPNGYQMSVIDGPGYTTYSGSTFPVVKAGGYTYWPATSANTGWFVIVAVDSSINFVYEWGYSGDRYVWGITIDSVARTVIFKGQSCGYPGGSDPDGSGIVIMPWDSHYPPDVE